MTDTLQNQIDSSIQDTSASSQFTVSNIPFHLHNGGDSNKISFSSLNGRKGYAVCTIQGLAAATSKNYGVFFILPFAGTVTGVTEVHATAGTDGSAVTLQVEKLTGTTVPGSGMNLLMSTLSLKSTINTVQTGTLLDTNVVQFAIGDRLAIKTSGVLTAVAGVTVVVEITY